MSVEASELLADDWTRWQGYVVNGVFPLGRLLGSSGHSGVFESKAAAPGHGQVAIKLIPDCQGQAERQLPRWTQASRLSHAHVLPLLDSGACRLDGSAFLYVVMQYADQTLAQLLLRRALTAEEARDMLPPLLEALAHLHGQQLVQGGLKPANILVVGDQLKVASDTIRPVGDSAVGPGSPSAFDASEGGLDGMAAASDVWGLGISLYEALTRRSPANLGARNSVMLPSDFPPGFRDVVERCLRHHPQDRPTVTDLLAWMGGQPLKPIPVTVIPPAAWERPKPRTSDPAPAPAVPSEAPKNTAPPVRPVSENTRRIPWGAVAVSAAVIMALSWTAAVLLRPHSAPKVAETASIALATQIPAAALPSPTPVHGANTTNPDGTDATELPALHEELPAVARSAARTIRGQVKVSVRAVVDPSGAVSRVVLSHGGPSRYFQKFALKAAQQWRFAPAISGQARQVDIQFDFSRDSTTGRAILVPSSR